MGNVTLIHTETDTVPECRVVFSGYRLQEKDKTDMRRIELSFTRCWYTRTAPKHDDKDLDSEGFKLLERGPQDLSWPKWRSAQWRATGYCPYSGFWIAVESRWLTELSIEKARHYVVSGRDGFVELIAEGFSWREWLWEHGDREEVPSNQPFADSGEASRDDTAHSLEPKA